MEEYIKSVLGSRYLGDGIVLCGYCLESQLPLIDVTNDYICQECEAELCLL